MLIDCDGMGLRVEELSYQEGIAGETTRISSTDPQPVTNTRVKPVPVVVLFAGLFVGGAWRLHWTRLASLLRV